MFSNLITILFVVAQSGLINGRVADAVTGEPVAGANVSVVGTTFGAPTHEGGGFVIGPLKVGHYSLVASHVAFAPDTVDVDVSADYVARPVLTLRPKVIQMPEVRSRSDRREPEEKMQVREIGIERLQRQAGGFVQDPVRSLSFLPGVAPSSRGEWSGAYAVRGGEPDESSIWFGDVELLWPYHLLGFSSVINPDIVDKISFYPSVFPTRYGGVLSSIAVLTPKDIDQGEGYWAYDPMNVKAAYVGNLDDITYIASYRRTFYNVMFGPMGAGTSNRPTYSDLTAQVAFPLGGRTRLRATVVNGTDAIASNLRGIETELVESGSSLALTAESDIGKGQAHTTFFFNTHDFVLDPAVWWGTAVTTQHEYGLRSDFSVPLSTAVEAGGGLELSRQTYAGNLLTPSVLQRADNGFALYASLGLKPVKALGIDFGLRYEDVRWAPDVVLSPRVVVSWFAGKRMTFRAGYRRHFQDSYSFLRSSTAAFVFDEDYDGYRLFETGALRAKQADHYSVSAEFQPAELTRLTLEGYLKDYSHLPTWKSDVQGRLYDVGNSGTGFARGIEATFEQGPVNEWSGWLTYSLSWVKKQQGTDTIAYWDQYDRRHALGLTVQRTFGNDWSVTGTFHLNTGSPYTPLLYTQTPQDGTSGADLNHGHSRYVIEGEKNSARVPLYHRLDLKVTRELPTLPLHPHIYIEVLNVYNRQNAYYLVQFEDREGHIVTGQSTGIPFIPLIGIGGRF